MAVFRQQPLIDAEREVRLPVESARIFLSFTTVVVADLHVYEFRSPSCATCLDYAIVCTFAESQTAQKPPSYQYLYCIEHRGQDKGQR